MLAAILLLSFQSFGQLSSGGEVVDIIDGRTIVVAAANGKVKIELQFIEVPQPGQELCDTVKSHLRTLLVGRIVEYKPKMIFADVVMGRVLLKNVDVSQQMLRDGAAWHVPREVSGQEKGEFDAYTSMEAAAKAEKRGVWSVSNLRPMREIAASRPISNPPDPIGPKKAPGFWGDVNPSLPNVGALMNGYNAESKTGYLSTALMRAEESPENAREQTTAVDISYYYRETGAKGRQGIFFIHVLSISKRPRFHKDNSLAIIVNGKPSIFGKPKRTQSKNGDDIEEKLSYAVKRSTIESMVHGGEVYLKLGGQFYYPKFGLQLMLNNMLDLSR